MRTLYIDCFSGASGDMFLGAFVDLGVPAEAIERELSTLRLDGVHLSVRRVDRASLNAVKVDVVVGGMIETIGGRVVSATGHETHDHHDHHAHADHGHHHGHPGHEAETHAHEHGASRSLAEILQLIDDSGLAERVKHRARRVFLRIGEAEARAHGATLETVHFHEVGAVDAIVDVVGTLVCLELLGVERVVCSEVTVGSGTVTFSHGDYPVPTPATLELLRGVPITAGPVKKEMVTPTGAALLTTISDAFQPMANLRCDRIGYGAGSRDVPGRPNVLRLILGSDVEPAGDEGTVAVIEAAIDDATPEVIGYFLERAFAEGALDAYVTPIQMKKNRPGVALTVLVDPTFLDRMIRLVFRETSTIGLRHRIASRRTLAREHVSVGTVYGDIRIKIARLDGEIVSAAPEFDDCRQAAEAASVPIQRVFDAAIAAFRGDQHVER